MDDLDITALRTKVEGANTNLANLQGNAPNMLQGLKQSLTQIFAKGNPLLQQREGQLANYLSAGDRARADFLPKTTPQGPGERPVIYSPTELNALVEGRKAQALAPLLGTNQLITGMYGNVGDIIQGAGTGLQAQIEGARTQAANALNLYQQAIQQEQFNRNFSENQRQFDVTQKNKGGGGGTGIDPITQALLARLTQGNQSTTDTGIDPAQFDEPDQPQTPPGGLIQQTGQNVQAARQAGLPPKSFLEGITRPFDPRQYLAMGQLFLKGLTGG